MNTNDCENNIKIQAVQPLQREDRGEEHKDGNTRAEKYEPTLGSAS